MSSSLWKSESDPSEVEINTTNDNSRDDQEDAENLNPVTSHVHLKPAHGAKPLDKEVVLRRIRQRKRHNMVRDSVKGFLGLSSASKEKYDNVSVRWIDDAFAAP